MTASTPTAELVRIPDLRHGDHYVMSGDAWQFCHREETDTGHAVMFRRRGKVITKAVGPDAGFRAATPEQVAADSAAEWRDRLIADLSMLIDLIAAPGGPDGRGVIPVLPGITVSVDFPIETTEELQVISTYLASEVKDTYGDGTPMPYARVKFPRPDSDRYTPRPLEVDFRATNPKEQ